MTTFDERERAFEAKFARDEEMEFHALARRDRMLGEWAGGLLGKTGEALESYAASVVRTDVQHPGDEDVVAQLTRDLEGWATPEQIRERMAELMDAAREQMSTER